MTEKEKMLSQQLYDPSDYELIQARINAKQLCHLFNHLAPSENAKQKEILHQLLGTSHDDTTILPWFICDYGFNIYVGRRFFANHNTMILDCATVIFGDDVLIGPNCSFYTACHPLDASQRIQGIEFAKPITIGKGVWIGGNVTVLPGVTIGDYAVIGAGSVVTKDIPSHTLAVGNPCHVIKTLDQD